MTNPNPSPEVIAAAERLAADIRSIDGNHDLGAGELAEKLVAIGYRLTSADEDAKMIAFTSEVRRLAEGGE